MSRNRRNGTQAADACPETAQWLAAQWYALRTRSRFERTVRDAVEARNLAAYLPLYQTVTRWSDRTKTTERPLFPGYVFVCAEPGALADLLQIAGVVSILPSSLRPAPIPDAQIEAVKRVLAMDERVLPCAYVAGQEVTIHSGPLAGVAGVVVRTEDAIRIIVRIQMLNRAVSVAVDAGDLEKTNL
jgi:transcription antitermination factor NusG